MLTCFLAAFLSLLAPPSTWQPAPKDVDATPLITKIYGAVSRQYALANGGSVQVRAKKCGEKDDCSGDLAGQADDYVHCYCDGKCAPVKQQCSNHVDEPEIDWGGLAWARSSNGYGNDKAIHVFLIDRWAEEKKKYAVVYNGPTSGIVEFVAATDKLKRVATKTSK